jgi:hypothetical protein
MQKLNPPAQARRIARSSRQIPTPSGSKKIPGPQSSSPVLLPPLTPSRGPHRWRKRRQKTLGRPDNLVAHAARLSGPAEPTSKTSAGLPINLAQAPSRSSILTTRIRSIRPAAGGRSGAGRRPSGRLKARAGRGILGGSGSWNKMGQRAKRPEAEGYFIPVS